MFVASASRTLLDYVISNNYRRYVHYFSICTDTISKIQHTSFLRYLTTAPINYTSLQNSNKFQCYEFYVWWFATFSRTYVNNYGKQNSIMLWEVWFSFVWKKIVKARVENCPKVCGYILLTLFITWGDYCSRYDILK